MRVPPGGCQDCFKGLRNEEAVFGDGFDYTVFSDAKPLAELEGWNGSSVNWDLPNGNAIKELLERLKNGQIQFKAGAIKIPRSEIDKLIRRYGSHNLAYEHREENDNDYHGHILFSSSLNPKQKTTISAQLANCPTCQYIPNHQEQE